MRHYKKGRKLGTDASHTKAIKKNLMVALFTNDRIKTTLERAKEVRGDVDRLITWAKRGDIHSRRLAIAKLGDKHLVAELFAKVEQGMYEGRPGGYTRILRLGKRRGDAAVIVILELVQEPVKTKKKIEKPAQAGQAKKESANKATGDAEKVDSTDEGQVADTETEIADPVIDVEPVEASVESEVTEAADTADADVEPAGDNAAAETADDDAEKPESK